MVVMVFDLLDHRQDAGATRDFATPEISFLWTDNN